MAAKGIRTIYDSSRAVCRLDAGILKSVTFIHWYVCQSTQRGIKMNETKNHQLYEELKRKFRQMEADQVFVITALGLERIGGY